MPVHQRGKNAIMAKITTKAFKKRLLQMREQVAEDSELTQLERKPVALDQSMVGRLSRMDAIQNQSMALEAERRRAIEITRIDAALQRIEEGEFGYCAVCGEDIEPKRLEHDPPVPACIACARGTE
jgi:DnaK suppressor protein